MNSLLAVFFLGLAITLSQARYSHKILNKEETNLLFNRVETLQKTDELIGETKVSAQFYAVETDTKWAALKRDKHGVFIRLLRRRNGTEIKEIRIDTDTSKSAPSITSTTTLTLDNNNVKMPLNQNDYYEYNEIADTESKSKSNEYHYDYFPSQVAIFSWSVKKNSIPSCAGSLISNRYVLTTANCVEDTERIQMVFGARNMREPEPFRVEVESSNFIIHEQWDSITLKSNIALIKLSEPIEFNEYISAVNLPTKADENKTFTDYNATLVAWTSDREKRIANPVNTTDIIISNAKCFLTYQSIILSSHICLASSRSKSSCVGESGDQLIVKDDNGTVKLIGLLSLGMLNGCVQKQPVVCTRITSYLPWILRHAEML